MTPTEIKISLLRAGLRQSDLAREYGCTPVTVHQVITGKGTSRLLQAFLARKLKLPVARMFPRRRAA